MSFYGLFWIRRKPLEFEVASFFRFSAWLILRQGFSANQEPYYIQKYINVIHALGSAHVKIGVDLQPFFTPEPGVKNGSADPNKITRT